VHKREEWLARSVQEGCVQITIDGPAGAGKSTVGKALAEALGCRFLDTGLMYRAVTLRALEEGVLLTDEVALMRLAREIQFALAATSTGSLLVDGHPAGRQLHSPPVDAAVSVVSAHPSVREEMVARQRSLAQGGCVVMVGRDIGTTVLPDAPVKLWVTASPQERARRRVREQAGGEAPVVTEEMVREILERDRKDAERGTSPLRQPLDARVIQTDRLSPDQVVWRALEAVGDRLGCCAGIAKPSG
jgi:cytidylate kinase